MPSIFNPIDNQNLIARIQQLTSTSQALWGKMTVDQMFVHCSKAIDVAFNTMPLKVNLFFKLLGRLLKNKVIVNGELSKNSPTANEFLIKDRYDFQEVQTELITKVQRFSKQGPSCIQLQNHPFWGPLSTDEWDKLMWNHLNHHLEQFGV